MSQALCFPLCNLDVFKLFYALLHRKSKLLVLDGEDFIDKKSRRKRVELPKRLFKGLLAPGKHTSSQIPQEDWELLHFLLENDIVDPKYVPEPPRLCRVLMLTRLLTALTMDTL